MNKRISDWSIVNKNLHQVLIVLSVPMLFIILWQLYTSDKVIEVMRSNDLVMAAVLYFAMIAIEIGVLAFILRVGKSEWARRITALAVLVLPFVWILFNSTYTYYDIGVFGLEYPGVPAYFVSVTYSLVLLAMVYKVFALPYNINSGVAIESLESDFKSSPTENKGSKSVAKKKSSPTEKAAKTAKSTKSTKTSKKD